MVQTWVTLCRAKWAACSDATFVTKRPYVLIGSKLCVAECYLQMPKVEPCPINPPAPAGTGCQDLAKLGTPPPHLRQRHGCLSAGSNPPVVSQDRKAHLLRRFLFIVGLPLASCRCVIPSLAAIGTKPTRKTDGKP